MSSNPNRYLIAAIAADGARMYLTHGILFTDPTRDTRGARVFPNLQEAEKAISWLRKTFTSTEFELESHFEGNLS